jgi:uncharacterized protein
MQPVSDRVQQTITQVFTTFLSLMVKDVRALMNLYAEDAVVEFPYAFNTSRRLEGKKAIYNYLQDALAQMQNLKFTNIRVYPTTNPDVLWAEVHGEAVIAATGHFYEQDYVIQMETREGKIIHYREYWNPMIASKGWANTQDWLQPLDGNVE